jgi:hypothetical protein
MLNKLKKWYDGIRYRILRENAMRVATQHPMGFIVYVFVELVMDPIYEKHGYAAAVNALDAWISGKKALIEAELGHPIDLVEMPNAFQLGFWRDWGRAVREAPWYLVHGVLVVSMAEVAKIVHQSTDDYPFSKQRVEAGEVTRVDEARKGFCAAKGFYIKELAYESAS